MCKGYGCRLRRGPEVFRCRGGTGAGTEEKAWSGSPSGYRDEQYDANREEYGTNRNNRAYTLFQEDLSEVLRDERYLHDMNDRIFNLLLQRYQENEERFSAEAYIIN